MMNFDYRLPAALVGVIVAGMTQIQIAIAQSGTAIEQTAREIAVSIGIKAKRFDGSTTLDPLGSGVIIAGKGNNYYVLTAAHNFEDGDGEYVVTTHDGNSYPIQERYPMRDSQLGNLDILVARFTTRSNQPSYRLAKWLDNSEGLLVNSHPLQEGATIYICGFPQSAAGLKVIRGQFRRHRPGGPSSEDPNGQSLGGYSLSYEADIDYGMSGSPILDQNGYLVGIHGRQEYEAQKKLGIAIETVWAVAKSQLRNQILAAKESVDRPSLVTTISVNQNLRGQLRRTDGDNPLRLAHFRDDYRLSGVSPGQQVQVNLNSGVFDTYLQLVDASTGSLINFDNDGGKGLNSQLTFQVKPGVDYLIRVTSYETRATGNYTLKTSSN